MAAAVRYLVADVDRAVAFYVEHLGFELVEQMGAAFAQVRRGDLTLWLSGPASSAARPMPDGRAAGGRRLEPVRPRGGRPGEPGRGHARRAGVTFRNAIVTGPGGKQILVEDPDGNVIELFEARR